MELTKEYIQQVEQYLDAKKLTYVDIRLEVLDHIISDIEYMMENEHKSFETSFRRITIKWNSQLRPSSSWFIGFAYRRPKIVIQKVNKFYLK